MSAEANFQNGNSSLAEQYINEVRARVGVAPMSGITIDDIYNERRLELSCEGHRFFDLVRTNKASSSIDGFSLGTHELFPIPQIEIDLAGGNWFQNPGY